ncbi:MAG: site-specific integrase [Campylobacteraceae bacterium]|jgi:integrase|nr:site-specific integrase [Campylobacteraceae bacterium]
MSKMINSKKFTGVFYKELINGDKSFYIVYKIAGKTQKVFIGKASEGINEPFCHQKRNEAINKARFGDNTPIIKYKNKSRLSFKEAVNSYVEAKKGSNSAKVTLAYMAIKDIFSNSSLDEITPAEINGFKNRLLADNKSPKTVNTYLQRINTIFNYAIDTEAYKGVNPCKKVDKPKIDNNRERYLSDDEVKTIKDSMRDNPMLLLFVELSLSTGGRLETIITISKKDINLNTRTVQLKNHKSKNSYHGFISNSLLPLLTKRYQNLKNPNDIIIPLNSRTIQRQLQPLLNKLFNQGLDSKDAKNRVVIHTLRHTFASHLAIKGTPIFTIMKLLDHKNIDETLRYAKLSPDNGLEAVKELWR